MNLIQRLGVWFFRRESFPQDDVLDALDLYVILESYVVIKFSTISSVSVPMLADFLADSPGLDTRYDSIRWGGRPSKGLHCIRPHASMHGTTAHRASITLLQQRCAVIHTEEATLARTPFGSVRAGVIHPSNGERQ